MTERPLLALVVEPGAGAELRPLVRVLAGLVDVRALGRCPRRPDALLVAPFVVPQRSFSSDPEAKRLGAELADRFRVRESSDVDHSGTKSAGWEALPVAVAVPGAVVVDDVHIPFPAAGIDADSVRPRGMLVRARGRERAGRPADWVVVVDELAPPDRAEALALAAAAVVGRDDLLLAIALGTAVVTDAGSAKEFGLVAGREVVVADRSDDAVREAEALAADPVRAAALGAAARRHAENSLDPRRAGRRVADALGLLRVEPGGGLPSLAARLQELHTPAGAPIRRRASDATAVLIGATP